MKPLAPGLFSITTGCLPCSATDWPIARAIWSVALPAANGTTKEIDFAGYVCAETGPALSTSIATAIDRIAVFIGFSSLDCRRIVHAMLCVLLERCRNLHQQLQQQESQRLAVRVEVQRPV